MFVRDYILVTPEVINRYDIDQIIKLVPDHAKDMADHVYELCKRTNSSRYFFPNTNYRGIKGGHGFDLVNSVKKLIKRGEYKLGNNLLTRQEKTINNLI